MPLYEYVCRDCGQITEAVRPMGEREEPFACAWCNGDADFVVSKPMILVDTCQDIPWMADFAKKRKEARFGHKPIETRTEYKKYLKEHDLRPADGDNLSEV